MAPLWIQGISKVERYAEIVSGCCAGSWAPPVEAKLELPRVYPIRFRCIHVQLQVLQLAVTDGKCLIVGVRVLYFKIKPLLA